MPYLDIRLHQLPLFIAYSPTKEKYNFYIEEMIFLNKFFVDSHL